MNLRKNLTIKLFCLFLLVADFLSPVFFQADIPYQESDLPRIVCHVQWPLSHGIAFLFEESKDSEGKSDKDCLPVFSGAVFFPRAITTLAQIEVATCSFVTDCSRFEVHPPLFKLNRELLI